MEDTRNKGKEESKWTEIAFPLSVKSRRKTVKIHMLIILVIIKND